jgi:hypothetical protein
MVAGLRYATSAQSAQKTQLPTVTPFLRFTQPLPRNGSFFGSKVLALKKYRIHDIYNGAVYTTIFPKITK